MMGKKEKRIIGFMLGLIILASAIPSLIANPSGDTVGGPAVKATELPNPYIYLPSLVPILAADMLAIQQGGGSDAVEIIHIASIITILRPSKSD